MAPSIPRQRLNSGSILRVPIPNSSLSTTYVTVFTSNAEDAVTGVRYQDTPIKYTVLHN
jgi:hypothetical protein